MMIQHRMLRRIQATAPTRLASMDCSGHKGPDEDDIVHLDDNQAIKIPVYPDRPDEPLATRKSRYVRMHTFGHEYIVIINIISHPPLSLIYQSRKRGMLENDLLLSTFAYKFLPDFNADQTMQFDRLINKPSNDWDIYYWATEKKPTPPEYENEIMKMLRKHVLNHEREERRMPDL